MKPLFSTLSSISAVLTLCLLSFSLLAANTEISQKTYKKISQAQELISAEQYSQALEQLTELKDSLSPSYGLALVLQLQGQTLLAQDADKNLEATQVLFQQALALNVLPLNQQVSLAANSAQLYLADEKVAKAITLLQPILQHAMQDKKMAAQLAAQPFIVLGAAYQLEQNFKQAIHWLSLGVQSADNKKQKVAENWLQMLMASHYQLKEYRAATQVLERLIVLKPKKESYWLQQASIFQLLQDSKSALATLEAAYVHQVLEKESAYIIFVQLLIQQGIPDRAARILSQLIKADKITLTENNWKLLASAWLNARERNMAAQALSQAGDLAVAQVLKEQGTPADKSKAAELYFRAGQLALENEEYKQAQQFFSTARKQGLSGEKRALSLLFQGNACHQIKNFSCAREYFLKAQKQPDTSVSAKSWLDYMMQMEQI